MIFVDMHLLMFVSKNIKEIVGFLLNFSQKYSSKDMNFASTKSAKVSALDMVELRNYYHRRYCRRTW
jgi:hypothetical protein